VRTCLANVIQITNISFQLSIGWVRPAHTDPSASVAGGGVMAKVNNIVSLSPCLQVCLILALFTFHFALFTPDANAADTWDTRASAPASVGNGASLVCPASGDTIYAFQGGITNTFWGYSISADSWFVRAATPASVDEGGGLVYPGSGDTIYALAGNATTGFWGYSISNNAWTSLTSVSGNVMRGGALVATGSDTIYAFQGNTTTTFWKYTISTNTWETKAAAPNYTNYGGSLVYPGSGDTLYALEGNWSTGDAFWGYSISNDTWTTKASTPAGVNYGGGLVYPGSGDIIYALRGGTSTNFWAYHISTNTWDTKAATPTGVSYGGALVYPGSGDTLYAFAGNTANFWGYRLPPASNSAGLLQAIHGGMSVIGVAPGETMTIRVTDTGVNTNPTVAETFTITMINLGSGEQETPVLTEKDTNNAIFETEFRFSGNSADNGHNSGKLYIQPGDTVRMRYTDPGDVGDSQIVNAVVNAVLDGKARNADTEVRQGDTAVIMAFSVTNDLPKDNASQTDTITGLQVNIILSPDTVFVPLGIKLWEDTGILGLLEPADILGDSRTLVSGVVNFTFAPRVLAPGDTKNFMVTVEVTDTAPVDDTIDARILKAAATHVLTGDAPDTDMNSMGVLRVISGRPKVLIGIAQDTIVTPASYGGAANDTIPGAAMTITLRYDNDGGDTAVNFVLTAKIPQNAQLGTGADSPAASAFLMPHVGATAAVTVMDDSGNVVADTDPNAVRIKWTFTTGVPPNNGDAVGVVDAVTSDNDAGYVKYKVYIK